MRIFMFIFLCCISGIALAQSINCTQYQQQVSQDWSQMRDIRQQLNQDYQTLNACLNVQTTIASPAYATAVQAMQTQSLQASPSFTSQSIYTETSTDTSTGTSTNSN